jgi:D-arabinose 1-dehydrogenase-like Zn-dependent alcohol dehydrogenase
MIKAIGYAAQSATDPLKPLEFDRQEPTANQVQIDILYCGICHSDIHQVRNEWHNTVYPCLPGHEIVGRVINIGENVTKFNIGDLAGVVSTDEAAMSKSASSFDFILSTIPTKHDLNPYIQLLKRDATIVLVGALEPLKPIDHSQVAFHRRSISGSLIGSIAETQEVLDFCAEHGIVSDVEVIPIQKINQAYERMLAGELKYRFVIDMESLKQTI